MFYDSSIEEEIITDSYLINCFLTNWGRLDDEDFFLFVISFEDAKNNKPILGGFTCQ